jgi:hypothetical protein
MYEWTQAQQSQRNRCSPATTMRFLAIVQQPCLHEQKLHAIRRQLGALCYGAEGQSALVWRHAADEIHQAQDGDLFTEPPLVFHERGLTIQERCMLRAELIIAVNVTCRRYQSWLYAEGSFVNICAESRRVKSNDEMETLQILPELKHASISFSQPKPPSLSALTC